MCPQGPLEGSSSSTPPLINQSAIARRVPLRRNVDWEPGGACPSPSLDPGSQGVQKAQLQKQTPVGPKPPRALRHQPIITNSAGLGFPT